MPEKNAGIIRTPVATGICTVKCPCVRQADHSLLSILHRLILRSWSGPGPDAICLCKASPLLKGGLQETGPSIVRSEKRPLFGLDSGSWRNSLVEETLRNNPKMRGFSRCKLNKTNNLEGEGFISSNKSIPVNRLKMTELKIPPEIPPAGWRQGCRG